MWRQDVTMTAGKMPALQFGMVTPEGCNNCSPGSANEVSATLGIKDEDLYDSGGVIQTTGRHDVNQRTSRKGK